MGLDVAVVAGASPQKIEVEVEGVGLVEESWTTLGAAGANISEGNITNILLAGMFIFVAFIYLFNRMLFWEVNNKAAILLLKQLGWQEKHIIQLSRQENLFLTFIGSPLSIPVLWAFGRLNMDGKQLFIHYGISVLVLV